MKRLNFVAFAAIALLGIIFTPTTASAESFSEASNVGKFFALVEKCPDGKCPDAPTAKSANKYKVLANAQCGSVYGLLDPAKSTRCINVVKAATRDFTVGGPNKCPDGKCGAHGSCTESTGKCSCSDGYTGAHCEIPPKINKCKELNVRCVLNATCGPKSGKCYCNKGYTNRPACDKCATGYKMDGDKCVLDSGKDPCEGVNCDFGQHCDNGDCVDDIPPPPLPICGDGKFSASESCDDGNNVDSDGCSATCQVEDGWECENDLSGEKPSVCTEKEDRIPSWVWVGGGMWAFWELLKLLLSFLIGHWTCLRKDKKGRGCGTHNSGLRKSCGSCGRPRPQPEKPKMACDNNLCPETGKVVEGKTCGKCHMDLKPLPDSDEDATVVSPEENEAVVARKQELLDQKLRLETQLSTASQTIGQLETSISSAEDSTKAIYENQLEEQEASKAAITADLQRVLDELEELEGEHD